MANLKTIYPLLTKLYYFLQVPLFNRFAFPPLQAFFDITYRCNLRCNMCHSLSLIEGSTSPENLRKELTFEQIKKIINRLPKKILITFTGGEPFLRKDIIDILSFAGKNHKCHVISNGTLISQETANSLIELRSRSLISPGLIMIGFSLEGPEGIHDEIAAKKGSFQKTISAIKMLQDLKRKARSSYPMIHVTTVLTSKNVSHLDFIYSLVKDLKLDYYNLVLENTSEFIRSQQNSNYSHLYESPPPPARIEPAILNSQLDKLERLASSNSSPAIRYSPVKINRQEIIKHFSEGLDPKNYRCYAPWTKIGFSAYGDVFCCPHVKVGNAVENNYDTLWNSPSYKSFRDKLKKEKSFPGCSGCCQSEYCGK